MPSTSTSTFSLGLILAISACDDPATPAGSTTSGSSGDESTIGSPPAISSDDGGSSTTGGGDDESSGTPEPAEGRSVFVTSNVHSPDFGGLAGGDQFCQDAAAASGREGVYKAWLSVGGESAADRLEPWAGPYVRTDGSQVAANWDNLIDGMLDVRINYDENGQLIEDGDLVWTGTNPDGSAAEENCGEWTTTVDAVAEAGSADDNGPAWASFGQMPCGGQYRLYCIEQTPVCGDGVVGGGEDCDDGNEEDGDDCTSACVEAVCGDGIVWSLGTGTEECDDMGESATCDADCTMVECGDGTTNAMAGEACDDMGESASCDVDCTVAECGDGVVNAASGEDCDDTGESAACDADCTVATCGDAVVNTMAGEVCDDGGESVTCNADCTVAACGDGVANVMAGEACDDMGESAMCNADCSVAACGDGVTNMTAGEACDDMGGSAMCNADCTLTACGDGVVNMMAGEACDDMGESATCNVDCTVAACGDGVVNMTAGESCDDAGESAACDVDCTPALCGDGAANPAAGEECDDAGESVTCDADCTFSQCGDGVANLAAGEECDDGGANADDAACTLACVAATCGDGLVHAGVEGCDDGNADETDACTTLCDPPACNDGLTSGDETDLDCGGSCGACSFGSACAVPGDCLGGSCIGSLCAVATQIAAKHYKTCAIVGSQGTVRCWGDGSFGQLGTGGIQNLGDGPGEMPPLDVDVGGPAIQIATGYWHTCALIEGGFVRCWGSSSQGQLGYSSTQSVGDGPGEMPPPNVDIGGTAVQVVAGYEHTCALLDNGDVRCWGDNIVGQLGTGGLVSPLDNLGDTEVPSAFPVVPLGGTAVQLSTDRNVTCAVLDTGGVRCWGEGAYFGHGYVTAQNIGDDETPAMMGDVIVGGLVEQVAVGTYHTCALLQGGDVRCWGRSTDLLLQENGHLGSAIAPDIISDNETPASRPVVDIGGVVTQLAAGTSHTCALLQGGDVRCWGRGAGGRLGYGNLDTIGDDEVPSTAGNVSVGGVVTQVVAGEHHTCVLYAANQVRCWGTSNFGQLGYGNLDIVGDDELPTSAPLVAYQ